MKKICLIKWIIDGVDGGLKVAINIANNLESKYEVHILSITSTRDIFFDFNNSVKHDNLFKGKLSMRKNYFKLHKELRKYFKENDIDIAFGIGISMNLLLGTSTIGLKTKAISCDHMNSISANFLRFQKIQRRLGTKLVDKIVVLTDKDRENYLKKYRIKNSKICTIYNWIEKLENSHEYSVNSKKLITVGRFDKAKGYDYLAKVAINILSKYPEWEWNIYGVGDEKIKQELVSELEKGGVLSQVNFLGNVKGTENIYPGHSIYVMTSRYEGLPLVLLEAKQYGLPIVSFNCPTGPSEMVLDGENGFLINDYNIDKMSDKIVELIEDEELREVFSHNSMKDTEKFNKETILKQWIDLIEGMTK